VNGDVTFCEMNKKMNNQIEGDPEVAWSPSSDLIEKSELMRFIRSLGRESIGSFTSFEALHGWAVSNPDLFWPRLMKFVGVRGEGSLDRVWDDQTGPTPLAKRWFPDFKLNFAENLLVGGDDEIAIAAWSEGANHRHVTRGDVREQALSIAAYLESLGVGSETQVFAYLPNIPEAVVCMLGAAAIGATWSSCGTDYQFDGLLSRVQRIAPTVFVSATSYLWRGARVDLSDTIRRVVRETPSIKHLVLITGDVNEASGARSVFSDLESVATLKSILSLGKRSTAFPKFPFSQPLYVMFSSGTTGAPKGIVHSAGGTLLEHKKEHSVHSDIRPGDRLFYQTSTSWMMWNWMVSALASAATIVLYDGDPLVEDGTILWRLAEEERVTHFGTSAPFLGAMEKRGIEPKRHHSFSELRAVLSTGSTLYPSQFDFIASAIKPVWVQSISGGTDIIGCFGLGSPIKSVVRGEVQAKSLGYDVRVYDATGSRVVEEEGELVCANAVPSMPIHFLNDPSGDAYRSAYFSEFPGVWRHGDLVKETRDGGLVFLGRSDATLKPAGVRVATADIYAALHKVPEVSQAMAVGYVPTSESGEKIVLFVVLGAGGRLTDTIEDRIRDTLRLSNVFYVPALIIQAPELPRTTNNKLSELSVKRVLRGEEPGNVGALGNPAALEFFRGEALSLVRSKLG